MSQNFAKDISIYHTNMVLAISLTIIKLSLSPLLSLNYIDHVLITQDETIIDMTVTTMIIKPNYIKIIMLTLDSPMLAN